MYFLLFAILVVSINAKKTSWYASYNLTTADVEKLEADHCYRGIYGAGDKRTLSLFTCPLRKHHDQPFAVLNHHAFLCVCEVRGPSDMEGVKQKINANDNYHILFAQNQEIVFVNRHKKDQHEKPDLCSPVEFNGLVDNTLYVPRTPVLPQQSPPLSHPAYIKSMLNKTLLAPDPFIAKVLETYSQDQVLAQLKALSTGNDGTNTKVTRNSYAIGTGLGGCADATWKCASHAQTYVTKTLNTYFADYKGTWSVSSNQFRTDMCHNVILEIRGETTPDIYVVTGAHLDSRNTGSGVSATGIAPGADDNGSGSAVHLEFARIIALNQIRFQHSVRLMWFCGEEQGLLGSAALARAYRQAGVNILGMFNMDMIGYTDKTYGVTLSFMTGSATPWLSASCKEFSRTYLPTLAVGDTQGCCSDQQSFYAQGYPAAGIFETPTRAVVYPRYHQTGDQWDNGFINYDQVYQFGKAISSCILEYATPLNTA